MTYRDAHGLIERSRTELAAGRTLAERGFGAQAVANAYYAAFFAAEASLLALGETRSKHSGVISAFGERLLKTGAVDLETGLLLRDLFELRNKATYDAFDVKPERAVQALADAERFLAAVEDWLRDRS